MRRPLRAGLLLGGLALAGCGGGGPLLHPAHTLPEGLVSFAAGSSGRFALGGLARANDSLEAAAATPGGAVTPSARAAFARGALTRFAVAPGVAPFVAGRIGLGEHNEAGMAYTGRALRIDARHAIEWPSYALSLGVGGSGALSHSGDLPEQGPHQSAGGLRVAELESLRGYGLDVPVLFGYRSDADVVLVWAGLRAGFERDDVDVSLVEAPDEAIAASAHATRLWAGGLVGFAVGLAPLQIRVELDAAYESVHGRLLTSGGELSARVDGLSLTPAAAISAKF